MLKIIIFAIVIFALGNICILGQDVLLSKSDIKKVKDEDLILKLISEDDKESTKAAIEIFKRGEKMFPHLLKLKGIKSIYQGYCLNDSKSGVGFSRPNEETSPEDANIDNGWYITAEVVSLYFISAIYYENLSFAQVPYLTGNKYVKERRYNTPERVKKAWKATEKWYKKLQKDGLEKLHQDNEFPLKSTEIHFVGTNPQRKRDISDCGQ